MSTQTKERPTQQQARPPIAHKGSWFTGRTLCGAKTQGIPAPSNAERCVVCVELARSRG